MGFFLLKTKKAAANMLTPNQGDLLTNNRHWSWIQAHRVSQCQQYGRKLSSVMLSIFLCWQTMPDSMIALLHMYMEAISWQIQFGHFWWLNFSARHNTLISYQWSTASSYSYQLKNQKLKAWSDAKAASTHHRRCTWPPLPCTHVYAFQPMDVMWAQYRRPSHF